MRGRSYDNEIKEQAYALYTVGVSITAIAEKLQAPRTTVKGWVDAAKKKSEEEPTSELADARRKNEEKMVDDSWAVIHDGMTILRRRFERAADREKELDLMMDEILCAAEDLPKEQLQALVKKFSALKVEDVGRISVVLGTLYDKIALITKNTPTDPAVGLKYEDF